MNTYKIAVIGGTGKSGTYLVNTLLHKGYNIKMLVRNPQRAPHNPLAEIITGNAADYDSIVKTLTGCNAVISTLGLGLRPSEPTIFSTATTHIVKAMQETDITRYVVTAGLNVDAPGDNKGPAAKAATEWMHANYPASTRNRQDEYNLLTQSNVNWTMVRLPMSKLTDAQPEITTSLTDCPGTAISATSLACFLIGQIGDNEFVRKAPFIANK